MAAAVQARANTAGRLFQATGMSVNNGRQQRGGIKDKNDGDASESAAGPLRRVLLISCLAATLHLSPLPSIQLRLFLVSPGDLQLL